ncbi:hypothetical protein BKA80DRAFT_346149 [Phyllosticta citrichinensis]
MSSAKPVLILDIDSDSSNSEDDNKTPPRALRPAEQQRLKDLRDQIRQAEAEELQQIVKEREVQEAKVSELQTRNAKTSQRRIYLGKETKSWKKVKKVVSSVATAKREIYDNTKAPELYGIMEDADDTLGMLRIGKALIEDAKRPKPRGK